MEIHYSELWCIIQRAKADLLYFEKEGIANTTQSLALDECRMIERYMIENTKKTYKID